MRTLRIALAALLIAFTSVFAISSARAGELNVLGGKLAWSDRMYIAEGGCSRYDFQYSNETGVELLLFGFELNDPFGRNLANWTEVGINPNKSGTWNVQICPSAFKNGLGPYVIKLIVKDFAKTQRQESKEIYFLPIPGATPTPTPTVTVTATPAPAPTVTVTATPAPAPKVTVTATPAPAPTVTVTATPAPAPTVTVTAAPAPAPTVTVTATPAPAPTVTVTATPAPIYIENPTNQGLTSLVTKLNSQVKLLNAKVKKICAVKPKPKGC